MSVLTAPEAPREQEQQLVARAVGGDDAAFTELVEPWRKPLFGYIHRMVTQRQDAEDLLQDTLLRAHQGLPTFHGDSRFKSWVFGIATHVCLDHLRGKKRWRWETQLDGEQRCYADPQLLHHVVARLAAPDCVFEVREHVAACFSCVARTLEPEQQAALMLREVLGFSNQEAAHIAGVSEPVFRHRLSAARDLMVRSFEGLCTLINKQGACWQCKTLREMTPEANRGADLVEITVAPNLALTPENLFDARLAIVRQADLEHGRSHKVHDYMFEEVSKHEEGTA